MTSWFIVVGRRYGADEDSHGIFTAASEEDAVRKFVGTVLNCAFDDDPGPEPEYYITRIFHCGDRRPEVM